MKALNKTLSITLEVIGVIGLVVVLIFAFRLVRTNFVPFSESNGKALAAYPPPEATPVETLFPTETPAIDIPSAEPTATPTPIVLDNGWYLYTDPDLEFSFAYPPRAHISAGKNPVDLSKNITIQFQVPDKPFQGMSIRIEPNPKQLDGNEIAKQLFEKSSQKKAPAEFAKSLKPISVGKLIAIEASIPSMNTETTVIVPKGDKVLIISPVHDAASTKVEKETLELYYQILVSFQFNLTK